jgi:hypothetical protein
MDMNMDIDMHLGHGHAPGTWTCTRDMEMDKHHGCRNADKKFSPGQSGTASHGLVR